jgi:hypothetical protein
MDSFPSTQVVAAFERRCRREMRESLRSARTSIALACAQLSALPSYVATRDRLQELGREVQDVIDSIPAEGDPQ